MPLKTPAFWYASEPSPLAIVLKPLASLYALASSLRRAMAKPMTTRLPLICIGNLVAGGAGKTPTALALAKLLRQQGYKPCFVSRGYGGRIQGPIRVNPAKHTFQDVGDEALLLAAEAPCWIGQDRPATLREAEEEPGITHIIMDDGFQNPHVTPWLSLLVVDGPTGFGNGQLIPAGPLRETLDQALPRVASLIMIGEDRHNIAETCGTQILTAELHPYIPDDFPDTKPYFAFAGLGRPEKFFETCRSIGLRLEDTKSFADHHPYTDTEIEALLAQAAERNLQLVTTAKDWVRLPPSAQPHIATLPVRLILTNPAPLQALLAAASLPPTAQ